MKKQRPFFFFGTISLLVVMVILVLACFAVLSLVSANNDYKLSSKNAQVVSDYYDADATAEDKLARIVKVTSDYDDWQAQLSSEGYDIKQTATGASIYYDVYVSTNKIIAVRIDIEIDANGTVGAIERAVWQTKSLRDE